MWKAIKAEENATEGSGAEDVSKEGGGGEEARRTEEEEHQRKLEL